MRFHELNKAVVKSIWNTCATNYIHCSLNPYILCYRYNKAYYLIWRFILFRLVKNSIRHKLTDPPNNNEISKRGFTVLRDNGVVLMKNDKMILIINNCKAIFKLVANQKVKGRDCLVLLILDLQNLTLCCLSHLCFKIFLNGPHKGKVKISIRKEKILCRTGMTLLQLLQ